MPAREICEMLGNKCTINNVRYTMKGVTNAKVKGVLITVEDM